MPGHTPYEALRAFLEPFEQNLAILDGVGQINVSRSGGYRVGGQYSWVLNGGTGMHFPRRGLFKASMAFEIVECDASKYGAPIRVTTRGYNYKLYLEEFGCDAWRMHWHPDGVSDQQEPHLHQPPSLSLHRRSPRMTFELAIRWCITDGIPTTCELREADAMLASTEWLHQLHRSWTDHPGDHADQSG